MIHCVRQAGAGGWSWCGVREKHCYLAGGWSWSDVRGKYCSAGGLETSRTQWLWWILSFLYIYWSTSLELAKIESGLVWSLLPCSITQSSQEQIISTLLARCLGMMPPKVVAVLLLLLSVSISPHHATGECTETQKEAIIENCKVYIRKVAPPHI